MDGTSGLGPGAARDRRPTQAILSADADTFYAVAVGIRPIAAAVASGDLRIEGDARAVPGLTGLLQALTGSPEQDSEQVQAGSEPAGR